VILLTGATGSVGSALLRRLVAEGEAVRCLVRDPRRLGDERVRVQIVLGDVSEPASFRNALRGVKTVVHLAASTRNQQRASIEELNGVATMRFLRAAERMGAERFLYFSALGASLNSRSRFLRAKALAEQAVAESDFDWSVLAPSLVHSPHTRWVRFFQTLSLLPAVPVSGRGRARFQPVWADDVAEAVLNRLRGEGGDQRRFELAGPETLSYDDVVRAVIAARGRERPLVHVPPLVVRAGLWTADKLAGDPVFATWDEAQLMEVSRISRRGDDDMKKLGVSPRPLRDALAAG
jgi:NADH dehydrogenase